MCGRFSMHNIFFCIFLCFIRFTCATERDFILGHLIVEYRSHFGSFVCLTRALIVGFNSFIAISTFDSVANKLASTPCATCSFSVKSAQDFSV